MTERQIFYDKLGQELYVGAVVVVPQWRERVLCFGSIKEINIGGYTKALHKVRFNLCGMDEGEWRGDSLIVVDESLATVIRLRDYEPATLYT